MTLLRLWQAATNISCPDTGLATIFHLNLSCVLGLCTAKLGTIAFICLALSGSDI